MSRRAKTDISVELLREALGLPEGTGVILAPHDPYDPAIFTLHLTHSDFPEVPEGGAATELRPVFGFSKDAEGYVRCRLMSWGIEEE